MISCLLLLLEFHKCVDSIQFSINPLSNNLLMQRRGLSEVVNILRYNSPSKAVIKRTGGMPKYIKERPKEEPPVDYSKLKFQTKEEAPFAVFI